MLDPDGLQKAHVHTLEVTKNINKKGGKEIHFLTGGFYKIMDGAVGGARIRKIKDMIEEHL